MSNGNNPIEWPDRSSLMTITIEVENGGVSSKRFKLYPGTEMVYIQKVDLAVTTALAETSVAAYEIIKDILEDAPGDRAAEVALGMAVT